MNVLGLALVVVQVQWVHLGTQRVNFRTDHDIVRTASEGRFRRLRVVVEGGDIALFDIRITFGDGTTFSPPGQFSFKGNSRSRVIALPGGARVIRWVDFYYRSISGGPQGRATIHVYARR
jgi:hypothetical protein